MRPPDLIRCQLCREVVESNRAAYRKHIDAHSWWERHQLYWLVSRPLAIAYCVFEVLIIGLPAFFIGRQL